MSAIYKAYVNEVNRKQRELAALNNAYNQLTLRLPTITDSGERNMLAAYRDEIGRKLAKAGIVKPDSQ